MMITPILALFRVGDLKFIDLEYSISELVDGNLLCSFCFDKLLLEKLTLTNMGILNSNNFRALQNLKSTVDRFISFHFFHAMLIYHFNNQKSKWITTDRMKNTPQTNFNTNKSALINSQLSFYLIFQIFTRVFIR